MVLRFEPSIRRLFLTAVWAAVLVVAGVGPVLAQQPVTFEITGTVAVDPAGTGLLGEPFRAVVSFDTQDAQPGGCCAGGGDKIAPVSWVFFVGPDRVATVTAGINFEDDGPFFDGWQVVDEGTPWNGRIAGREIAGIAINFQDHDFTALDGKSYSDPLDLPEFEVANGTIDLLDGAGNPLDTIFIEVETFTAPGFGGRVCIDPPADMIAWWPGDASTEDLIAGRDGTLVGGAGYTPGIVAEALEFLDRGSDWVEVPDDPAWDLAGDFSIDFFVDLDTVASDAPNQQAFIAHDEGPGELPKWAFWLESGYLTFHVNGPAPDFPPGGYNPVSCFWGPIPNATYHVAVTREGDVWSLYSDGSLLCQSVSSVTIPDAAVPLTLGKAENTWLEGWIDEVEIFGRALSAAEVKALFLSGGAGKCKDCAVDLEPPTVACNAADTITPPDAPIAFTATAEDDCGEATVEITGFDCSAFTPNGRRIDKTGSCVVEISGDTVTVEDAGGVGTSIVWQATATDAAGNTSSTVCGPVAVANPGRGGGRS